MSEGGSNPMWGGRFARGPAEIMRAINVSIGFDRRLAVEDIAGSRAHAAMLSAQGIIPPADETEIQRGLTLVEAEIAGGTFPFRDQYEDIHLNIEARLAELIGAPAGRLHTARSRNDQVALDLRLWTRAACDRAIAGIAALQRALLEQAEAHIDTVMPGFTHLQPAQPITLGHHLMAHVEMLGRDAGRFVDARARLNESPLGAAALAGTGFPIDRAATAKALGFERPMANSLDAVSARDFALETLAASAICGLTLSRLAEELVLWTSAVFGFARLSDAYATGSSIMPQKRNADAAELVRGKSGRLLAAFTGLAMVVKALPLAYGKDLQEDKEPLFDAFDTLELCLAAMTGMIGDLAPDPNRLAAAAEGGFTTATDLADWLVRELGLTFRAAHHVAGAAVKRAEALGVALADLPLAELQTLEPRATADALADLSPRASLARHDSLGGPAPARVREQIARWRERLGD